MSATACTSAIPKRSPRSERKNRDDPVKAKNERKKSNEDEEFDRLPEYRYLKAQLALIAKGFRVNFQKNGLATIYAQEAKNEQLERIKMLEVIGDTNTKFTLQDEELEIQALLIQLMINTIKSGEMVDCIDILPPEPDTREAIMKVAAKSLRIIDESYEEQEKVLL